MSVPGAATPRSAPVGPYARSSVLRTRGPRRRTTWSRASWRMLLTSTSRKPAIWSRRRDHSSSDSPSQRASAAANASSRWLRLGHRPQPPEEQLLGLRQRSRRTGVGRRVGLRLRHVQLLAQLLERLPADLAAPCASSSDNTSATRSAFCRAIAALWSANEPARAAANRSRNESTRAWRPENGGGSGTCGTGTFGPMAAAIAPAVDAARRGGAGTAGVRSGSRTPRGPAASRRSPALRPLRLRDHRNPGGSVAVAPSLHWKCCSPRRRSRGRGGSRSARASGAPTT